MHLSSYKFGREEPRDPPFTTPERSVVETVIWPLVSAATDK